MVMPTDNLKVNRAVP